MFKYQNVHKISTIFPLLVFEYIESGMKANLSVVNTVIIFDFKVFTNIFGEFRTESQSIEILIEIRDEIKATVKWKYAIFLFFQFPHKKSEYLSWIMFEFMHFMWLFIFFPSPSNPNMKWLRISFEFTGSGLYSSTGGGSITEIRIKSCREARAQLYDGYTVNKTGKYQLNY